MMHAEHDKMHLRLRRHSGERPVMIQAEKHIPLLMHHDQISRRLHTSSAAAIQRGSNWPMRLSPLVNAAAGSHPSQIGCLVEGE